MRRMLLAWSTLVGCAGGLGAERFSKQLPQGLFDMSGWELIAGETENQQIQAAYHLYVNPELQALYQVIRYRAHFLHPASESERLYHATEKLVWNERPGQQPLRCFERVDRTATEVAHWREMSLRSAEYDTEMDVVMQLLMLHRSGLQDRIR